MKLLIPELLFEDGGCRRGDAVLIDGDTIKDIGPSDTLRQGNPAAEVMELPRQVLVPGTVNAHSHCFQILLRGIAADRPFLEWRDRSLYHYSPRMNLEDIYNGALFAFAEMMKRGVTAVGEFFYLHTFGTESDEAVIAAAKDLGLRICLARTMYDWSGAPAGYVETMDTAVKNTKLLHRKYLQDPMVRVIPAPHSLHAASTEMILAGHELAAELGTKMHMHVAEEPFEVDQVRAEHNGMTPLLYLNSLGVVDHSLVIIHGVYLSQEEIRVLGEKGAGLIYCPSSNMFLADGITDIPAMMQAGVPIALGADGACGNNRISVFGEMRMCSLLQKARTCNALCVNYHDTFRMGTDTGARLLGFPAGRMEKGCLADFAGIDLDDFSMMPVSSSLEQVLPNIVYSMEPTAVRTVIVGGRVTVKDGILQTFDEQEIRERVVDTMRRLS